MANEPRLTPQVVAVLRALLDTPTVPRWGRDIAKETGLQSGTLHPILARLERAGWVESMWEDPTEHEDAGRPRRRYYRFASGGAKAAESAIVDADRASGAGHSAASATFSHPQLGY
jgi:PadR family transcriptional regulator, regulatory protein PadR